MEPIKLRRRAPFWCRAKDTKGKFIHLDCALTEADGDLCPGHAAERAEAERQRVEAERRFLETPIRPPKPEEPEPEVTQIWPE